MSADDWNRHYAMASGHRYWPSEELVRTVGARRVRRVLEAGCGNGANLWYLREHADVVAGVDFCHDALRAAVTYCAQRNILAHLAMADIGQLPFGEGEFDLVVDAMTSQHVRWRDHERVYREYRRVLAPHGEVFLMHLDAQTDTARQRDGGEDEYRLSLFPHAGMICLPARIRLVSAMTRAGFRVSSVRGVAREYANTDVAHYTIVEARAR